MGRHVHHSRLMLTIALLLAAGVSPARAGDVPMTPAMRALPFKTLDVYLSQPGETLKTFLLRVARDMRRFTHETGFEACGAIAKGPAGYGLALGTNESQIGCLAGEAGVPVGMTWTGETVHSHPEDRNLIMQANDKAYALATHSTNPYTRTFEGSPGEFSPTDFQSGPGYLVANGALLYQPGRKVRRPKRIGEVAAP